MSQTRSNSNAARQTERRSDLPCNRAGFREWFSAVRYCRWKNINVPLGPFYGLRHFVGQSLAEFNGLWRDVPTPAAHYYGIMSEARRATGKNYKRISIANARSIRRHNQISKRLP